MHEHDAARRPPSGTGGASRAAPRRRGAALRAWTAGDRRSSASRLCAVPPSRSGTPRPDRRARGARPRSREAQASPLGSEPWTNQGIRVARRRRRGGPPRARGRGAGRRVVAEAGDPASSRSCARPRSRFRRSRSRVASRRRRRDLAIASASHLADHDQLAAVRACSRRRRRRRRAGVRTRGRPAVAAQAQLLRQARGMLALCRPTAGAARATASRPSCPARDARRARGGAEVDRGRDPHGIDGCGVLTFALPLERMRTCVPGCGSSTAATASPPHARAPDADSRAAAHDTR
jgi:hypothetical protein